MKELLPFPQQSAWSYEWSISRKPIAGHTPTQVFKVEDTLKYLDQLGMAHFDQEHLYLLTLDCRNHITGHALISKGLSNSSPAHPREIFKVAILAGAAKIILAHNHPSGDPVPSASDLNITNKISRAGETFGIPLIDHVIIAFDLFMQERRFVSLQRLGHILQPSQALAA